MPCSEFFCAMVRLLFEFLTLYEYFDFGVIHTDVESLAKNEPLLQQNRKPILPLTPIRSGLCYLGMLPLCSDHNHYIQFDFVQLYACIHILAYLLSSLHAHNIRMKDLPIPVWN